MDKFCDNPLCRCNVDAAPGILRLDYTEANGNKVTVSRVIVRQAGRKDLTFCEICAMVLTLTQ